MQLAVVNDCPHQRAFDLRRLDATEGDLCELPAAGFSSQAGKESQVQPLLQPPVLLGQVSEAPR